MDIMSPGLNIAGPQCPIVVNSGSTPTSLVWKGLTEFITMNYWSDSELLLDCHPRVFSKYVNHIFRSYGKIRGGVNEWQLGFREYVLAIHESKAGSEEERLKRAFLISNVDRRGVNVADVYKFTGAMLSHGALDPEREARKLFLRLDPLGHGGGVGEAQFLCENTPKAPAGRTKTASNRLKMAKPD